MRLIELKQVFIDTYTLIIKKMAIGYCIDLEPILHVGIIIENTKDLTKKEIEYLIHYLLNFQNKL